jgi:DNA-binding transcriptional MerR regulator
MLSIGAVTRQTGIGASTLRKWELRYGFPVPVRSETGRRMFQESDVQRIHMVARALAQGQRASHAIESVLKAVQQPGVTDQADKSTDKLGKELARSIKLLQSDKLFLLQEHVEGALSRMGMVAFVEDFALPLVNEVGAQWQAGLLPIFREHVFSSHLSSLVAKHTKALDQKRLQRGQSKEARPVLLALPAGEHHRLALILFNALLCEVGLPTVVLQSGLPASEIADAAKAYRSEFVALSCSAASPKKLLHNELSVLRRLLPASVELWVGGAGALQLPSGIDGVVFSHSMRGLIDHALDKCRYKV